MTDIDLVLSGSGVRLGAHFGAIKALRKYYNIKRIAGTSGGAIIAAAFMCYSNFDHLHEVLTSINFNDLMCDGKWTSWLRLIKSNGLYLGDNFERFIDERITFGKTLMDIPELYIIATDLTYNIPLVLNAKYNYGWMKISQAIRMSMSAPLYWVPKYLTLDNIKHTIVDGGIAANYYIDIFDDNPRQTIGVSLYTKTKKKSQVGIINYFKDILDTMMTCNENEHIEDAHWSNTVKIDTGDITPFNLDIKSEQIEWTIIHGYQETLKALESKLKKEK